MMRVPYAALRLALAAVVAVTVGLVDEPLLGVNIHWLFCVVIGLVLVYGGILIVNVADDDV